ncbi:glycosyltransferase family 2 protein [Vreelandella populi]|uniref:glycosyltransferase family 2 protein n=1 Tax=Vreelandella populi TaxID=2498858 RepID=UPI00163CED26|nr:glycosyltransferase family 2 protein [Halomonas populi]
MRVDSENYELIKRSNLLNKKWYAKQYKDVELLGMDPIEHYIKYGAHLGRDPSANFSASFYRENFLEKGSNDDPLLHYLKVGSKKGYKIKPNALHLRDLLKAGNRVRAKYLSQFCNKTVKETFPIIEMAIETSGKESRGKEYADALNSSLLSPNDLSEINVSSEDDQNDFFLRIESEATSSASSGELITVIMPAYNSEATIAKSISSILKQTWQNLQLIVVDDCSSDKTYEVAQKALANDKRAILLKNEKNVGPYVSKNLALKYAKGEYITGQDADDWSHPQRLEKHMELIKKDGYVRASMAYMFRMQMDGTIEIRREGLLIGSSISTMYQAEFLKTTLGHWDCAKFGADSELISRAKKFLGDEFKYYKFPSMVCLASPDSLTSNPEYGVSVEHGLSPARVEYRKAWTDWHESIGKKDLYLPFPHIERKFSIPAHAFIPIENICENMSLHEN